MKLRTNESKQPKQPRPSTLRKTAPLTPGLTVGAVFRHINSNFNTPTHTHSTAEKKCPARASRRVRAAYRAAEPPSPVRCPRPATHRTVHRARPSLPQRSCRPAASRRRRQAADEPPPPAGEGRGGGQSAEQPLERLLVNPGPLRNRKAPGARPAATLRRHLHVKEDAGGVVHRVDEQDVKDAGVDRRY